MSEEEIDKVIEALAELDAYFEENLEEANPQKLCVSIKTKELLFWLSWFKENLGDDESE